MATSENTELHDIIRKICHKEAQLKKAEIRLADDNSTFQMNNYLSARRRLHELALKLAEATKDNI